jgi:two-component system sensor kinase FixL
VLCVVCTVVDNTDRKEAEEALRNSERELIEAQSVGHVGSWRLDLVTEHLTWTGETYRIFGVSEGTPMTFEGYLAIVHPVDRESVEGKWKAARNGRPFDIEYRILAGGQTRWVREKAKLRLDDDGNVVGGYGITQDISQQKQAEEEAHRQREILARVDRATRMGQLTGALAHELTQPLTGLLSNAQTVELLIDKGQGQSDEVAEIITDIIADTKRAGEVIGGLRDLYREQKSEFTPVDINAVIDETAHLMHSEFVLQHVSLAVECASSVPLVSGNKPQIQQVMVNLIMNAVQAMCGLKREDRRLLITTAYDANEVRAWVEDHGPGIDADKVDHIFEPLVTWKPGGTGMGLALSNSIIEAHGGMMWAENRPEGGARVGFAIPVGK